MELTIRASEPIKVTGEGFEDRVLQAGASATISGTSFSVATAPAEDVAPPPATDEVFDASNRPNGAMTAIVAPKMPKSSGELVQEPAEGGVVERAAADLGVATQGGGPNAEPGFKTPGPQPVPRDEAVTAGTAAATQDVNEKGQPVPRTEEKVQSAPTPVAKKK